MGRAERRHHEQRIKQRFYRKQRLHPYWATTPKSAGIYAHHGCTCSCMMCGNPRRRLGEKTMQERKALDERSANRGIYDGDTDAACVWHCTDDDPDSPCAARIIR